MGIGFVLISWLIIFIVLAIPTSAILCILTRSLSKSVAKELRKRRTIIASALPFALIVYFGCAFVLYGSWCFLVRNVDPGIGDGWVVPIGNDYTMEMIDTPEDAFIHKNGEIQIRDITLIGEAEPFVFGRSTEGYFILNVDSRELYQSKSESNFKEELKEIGIKEASILETPDRFYHKNRWGIADLIATLIIFSIPALGLYFVWRNYWRIPKHNKV
jgi:hypothetical protein